MPKLPKKRKSKESSFKLAPEGEYIAKVIKSSIDKISGGKAVVLTWKPKGEPDIKQWYCYEHENQKTEEIANESLDNIAFACGLDDYKKTEDFHGIDVLIDVSIDGKYNKINKYSPTTKGDKSSKKKDKKKKKKKKNW